MEHPFNISGLFFESVKKYPDKIAVIHKDEQVRFSELGKQVNDTASYFTDRGIGKGDRVLVFVPMSIDLYRIVLALFRIGATVVFLDEWVSLKRMEECCKVAQCKAFIGTSKAKALLLFSKELRKIPVKLGVSYTSAKADIEYAIVNKTDTALITFTTGSTGIPKAAKRTHGFLQEQFTALVEIIDPQANDIDMPVLPIVLLINLGIGCTSVIASFKARKPLLMNAGKIMNEINRYQVNRLVASPFFVTRLANFRINNRAGISSLKKIFVGGAPVFPSDAILYKKAFPESDIKIVYGSTEAEPISVINAKELIKNPLYEGLNVGTPYHNIFVKIISITDEPVPCNTIEELKQITLAEEMIGEIIVSGPHVLQEYYNNKAALKRNKIFIGAACWHRTGDSGFIGKDGKLYLTGRCNTLIDKAGEIVAPFVYEEIFKSIDGIATGTILTLNNKILAVISIEKNAVKDTITTQLKKMSHKFDKIIFITTIPRDPRHNSKIDYDKLKQLIEKKSEL